MLIWPPLLVSAVRTDHNEFMKATKLGFSPKVFLNGTKKPKSATITIRSHLCVKTIP